MAEKMDTSAEKAPEQKEQSPASLQSLISHDIISSLKWIASGVIQKNDRLLRRAWRKVYQYRKDLTGPLLLELLEQNIVDGRQFYEAFCVTNSTDMKDEETPAPLTSTVQSTIEEVELFIKTICLVYLIDQKQYDNAVKLGKELIQFIQDNAQRVTLYFYAAKTYFYYSFAHELNGTLSSIRGVLLSEFRRATVNRNKVGQGTLMTLLLRNYLNDNQYEQGKLLIEQSPDIEFKSTSELSRFLYYKGRIRAIQLEYPEAYECLMTAARKAPLIARGFRLAAFKSAIIVQLLMGEIPERSVFSQVEFRSALKPYLELTKQVRVGDLANFKKVVQTYKSQYIKDKTFTMIQRIRQNVIRTGLHKISLAYSKISFQDICEKLNLDNPEDVECIVAKAIRDGIISAVINHEQGYVQAVDVPNVYETRQPSKEFDQRIGFCFKIQEEALKSLRFPNVKTTHKEREKRKKDIEEWLKHQEEAEKKAEEEEEKKN